MQLKVVECRSESFAVQDANEERSNGESDKDSGVGNEKMSDSRSDDDEMSIGEFKKDSGGNEESKVLCVMLNFRLSLTS